MTERSKAMTEVDVDTLQDQAAEPMFDSVISLAGASSPSGTRFYVRLV
jgi:hypothetical protein